MAITYFCGTDYSTECGAVPLSFFQMLANTLVRATCDQREDQVRINVIPQFGYCDDLTSFWDCDIQNLDPERALVENAFALDECGNLGLKIYLNYGANPS